MSDLKLLEDMSAKMYVYDVLQGAWEQEPNGFEANAKHVLTHLSKDLILKDFTDAKVVREQITPDLIQYAVRLMRWSAQAVGAVEYPSTESEQLARIRGKYGVGTAHACYIAAIGVMAASLHDHDHSRIREAAIEAAPAMARQAAGFLLEAVRIQAESNNFDILTSFDNRLASLRTRFGIPEPVKA